jgi:hypothetical protein
MNASKNVDAASVRIASTEVFKRHADEDGVFERNATKDVSASKDVSVKLDLMMWLLELHLKMCS